MLLCCQTALSLQLHSLQHHMVASMFVLPQTPHKLLQHFLVALDAYTHLQGPKSLQTIDISSGDDEPSDAVPAASARGKRATTRSAAAAACSTETRFKVRPAQLTARHHLCQVHEQPALLISSGDDAVPVASACGRRTTTRSAAAAACSTETRFKVSPTQLTS